MPISRSARLALGGMNQYTLPMVPIRASTMAATSGPPARPSFSATGSPGTDTGMEPSSTPRPMPTNTGSICTCCSFCWALPTSAITVSMSSCRPTRLITSPNCSVMPPVGTSSIPARFRREITTSWLDCRFR